MSQHIDKEAFIDQMTQKCLEMREKGFASIHHMAQIHIKHA